MAKVKPRVKVPKNVTKGDIVEIKTLISHKMESGQRKDKKTGEKIPRQIINKFVCRLDGEEIFSSDWQPAISANPFMSFSLRAEKSGALQFEWMDDDGTTYSTEKKLTVS